MLPPDIRPALSIGHFESLGILTSEIEYRHWGKMNLLTVGLGDNVSNQDLAASLPEHVLRSKKILDDNGHLHPEKITELTGFKHRYQLREMNLTEDEAVELVATGSAAMGRMALEVQGWRPDDVDILVTLASFPPDNFSFRMKKQLGLQNARVVERSNSCPSPALALGQLGQMQKHFPNGANVLEIGLELLTPFVENNDLLLFSDRALATTFVLGKDIIVLSPHIPGVTYREYPDRNTALRIGPTHYDMGSMETFGNVLWDRVIKETSGQTHFVSRSKYAPVEAHETSPVRLAMDGEAVSKWILKSIPDLLVDTVKETFSPSDDELSTFMRIKMIIPHQANGALVDPLARMLARKLGIAKTDQEGVQKIRDMIYWCGTDLGNCASLTTPLALMRALEGEGLSEEERINDGDMLLVAACGAGLASAAAVIQVHEN